MKPRKIEISHRTIVFTVAFLVALAVLWRIRSLIALIFVCFVFMGALNPSVNRLEKLRLPRPLAIVLLYIVIISVVSFALAGIVPVLIEQTNSLITTLPQTLRDTTFLGMPAIDISSQFKLLESLPSNIAKITISIFSNLFSAFVVFVVTFYLLLERKNFDKYSFNVFGPEGKEKFTSILEQVETSLGRWINAEVLLMTVIGIMAYIGYSVMGLNYAVPLAIVAGLLEVVPTIGPIISTALAFLVGITSGWATGLIVILWGIVIQQLENNFIVPKIMKETIGINPLITIVVIAAGAELGGVMGAVLAIPIYIAVEIIIRVMTSK